VEIIEVQTKVLYVVKLMGLHIKMGSQYPTDGELSLSVDVCLSENLAY